jgi:hypothetical protein
LDVLVTKIHIACQLSMKACPSKPPKFHRLQQRSAGADKETVHEFTQTSTQICAVAQEFDGYAGISEYGTV